MWTLLEGLLHDHLDARDDAGHCIADLLDGLLADLPRPFDGPGGGRRGRLLDIEANLLGAGDGALDGVPRDSADIAADFGRYPMRSVSHPRGRLSSDDAAPR